MSEVFAVHGGACLQGQVKVYGAKNSVLKLMAAALLAPGTTILQNCPQILDTQFMAKVLEGVGAHVTLTHDIITIDSPEELNYEALAPVMRNFRASVCILGPLIARSGKAIVALPGGDAIGTRPLDIHRAGLLAMGVETKIEHGNISAHAHKLCDATFQLPWPSVGATENIMMAGVLSTTTTVIDNAAREPEIVDLCNLLIAMGADIQGAGTSTITVRGVRALQPTTHRVIGDRLVAATWATAAVITQGKISIVGINPVYMQVVLDKFHLVGADIVVTDNSITISQNSRPKAVNVSTLPYPGFPTDLQAMAVVIASISQGVSVITENVFDARFRFVEEMIRLGADARIEGHHAVLRGVSQLSSAPVWSTDVRAGAGLVLAGLCADGITLVHDIHHIDRGYPHFMENLNALGAHVQRYDTAEV